jgi:hypothetical protein
MLQSNPTTKYIEGLKNKQIYFKSTPPGGNGVGEYLSMTVTDGEITENDKLVKTLTLKNVQRLDSSWRQIPIDREGVTLESIVLKFPPDKIYEDVPSTTSESIPTERMSVGGRKSKRCKRSKRCKKSKICKRSKRCKKSKICKRSLRM